jgi:hypothetical protein
LQLGELAHHTASQVGFGEECRPLGPGSFRAGDMSDERAGEGHEALDPIALRAEVGVKDHLG